jgi:hypothetical protein
MMHWVRGSPCPKWNSPDSPNATWLDPPEEEGPPPVPPIVYIPDRIIDYVPSLEPEDEDAIREDMSHLVRLPAAEYRRRNRPNPIATDIQKGLRDYVSPGSRLIELDWEKRMERFDAVADITWRHRRQLRMDLVHTQGRRFSEKTKKHGVNIPSVRRLLLCLGRNNALVWNRLHAEAFLERMLATHEEILALAQEFQEHRILRELLPESFGILNKYLIVSPERFVVAAHDRNHERSIIMREGRAIARGLWDTW